MVSALLSLLLVSPPLAGAPALSAPLGDRRETHEFTVVAAKENQLILKARDGKEKKLQVPPDLKVTAGGKEVIKLTDLKRGDKVRITFEKKEGREKVVAIEAKRDRKR